MMSDCEHFLFSFALAFFLFELFDWIFLAISTRKFVKDVKKEFENNKENYMNDFLDRNKESILKNISDEVG